MSILGWCFLSIKWHHMEMILLSLFGFSFSVFWIVQYHEMFIVKIKIYNRLNTWSPITNVARRKQFSVFVLLCVFMSRVDLETCKISNIYNLILVKGLNTSQQNNLKWIYERLGIQILGKRSRDMANIWKYNDLEN